MHVEDPVRTGHDLDGADRPLPLLEDPRRQTGGVRKRSSGTQYSMRMRSGIGSILSRRSPTAAARRSGPLVIPPGARLIPGWSWSPEKRLRRRAITRGCPVCDVSPTAWWSEGAGVQPDPGASRTHRVSVALRTVRNHLPTADDRACSIGSRQDVRSGHGSIEGLVDEAVGELVVLAGGRRCKSRAGSCARGARHRGRDPAARGSSRGTRRASASPGAPSRTRPRARRRPPRPRAPDLRRGPRTPRHCWSPRRSSARASPEPCRPRPRGRTHRPPDPGSRASLRP